MISIEVIIMHPNHPASKTQHTFATPPNVDEVIQTLTLPAPRTAYHISIYGKKPPLNYRLSQHDRLELCLPLPSCPKEARRQRVLQAKNAKKASKVLSISTTSSSNRA